MIDIPDSVFPLDAQGRCLCPRCRKPVDGCECPEPVASLQASSGKPGRTVTVRLEKKGRQGKLVTVISGLYADPGRLKDLAARLKKSCGGGGTFYIADGAGVIELQGDQRGRLPGLIESEGLQVHKAN